MSEPIRVGDLVMVVRFPCCGACLGVVMTVTRLVNTGDDYRCSRCGKLHGLKQVPSAIDDGRVRDRHFPLSWLRRIDPLEEPETIEREEETT